MCRYWPSSLRINLAMPYSQDTYDSEATLSAFEPASSPGSYPYRWHEALRERQCAAVTEQRKPANTDVCTCANAASPLPLLSTESPK